MFWFHILVLQGQAIHYCHLQNVTWVASPFYLHKSTLFVANPFIFQQTPNLWENIFISSKWTSILINAHIANGNIYHSFAHSWSWALLEKPPIAQLLKNFPAIYVNRRFTAVFTGSLHWSLYSGRSIQSTPSHPISLRSLFNIVHAPLACSS
jgi:hypothetical protein